MQPLELIDKLVALIPPPAPALRIPASLGVQGRHPWRPAHGSYPAARPSTPLSRGPRPERPVARTDHRRCQRAGPPRRFGRTGCRGPGPVRYHGSRRIQIRPPPESLPLGGATGPDLRDLGAEQDGGHAFYSGVELGRAQTAHQLGKRYTQDQPLRWGCTVPLPEENLTEYAPPAATKRNKAD